ncbi:MAG: hypothetical protein RI894_75 [Bacteroidota bacterium]|jgi:hypothetical protein
MTNLTIQLPPKLKLLWKRITQAGFREGQEPIFQRRLSMLNLIYLNIMMMTLIFMGVSIYMQQGILNYLMCLSCTAMAGGIILFNHYQYYRTSIALHFLLSGLPMLFFTAFFGIENGFYLYILAFPASMVTFIDMDDKKAIAITSTYYFLLLLAIFILTELRFTDIVYYPKNNYILFINIIFTLIVIFILVYNFYRTNTSYQKEIEQKNQDLQVGKDEIEAKNIILTQKNAEIEGLVSELNDKVKNNLQIISFFTDFDSLNPPTRDIVALLLLQKSRIKVLNISYQLIFEDNITDCNWFAIFLTRYYSFIKANYTKKVASFSVSDIALMKNPLISKKRFEALMLLVNEWNFRALDKLVETAEIELFIAISEFGNGEFENNAPYSHCLTLQLKGHSATEAIVDNGLQRLSRARQINMETTFNAETNIHQLELLF